jgi:DNA-binding NtrC family response regulator
MSMALQAKLLRVIETRRSQRIGGLREIEVDVRFVSATSRDLEREAQSGRFRADLYYRLAGMQLHVPPLRERREEIPALVDRFVHEMARSVGVPVPEFSEASMQLLLAYEWPGNIRHLRNVVERAVLLTGGRGTIDPANLPRDIAEPGTDPEDPFVSESPSGRDRGLTATEALERQRIIDALAATQGNQTLAARRLRMSRSSFIARLAKYKIQRPRAS